MADNLDTSFKKALQGASVEPPAHLWEHIQEKIDRKRKRKILLIWRTGIAASLIMGFCLFRLTEYKNISPVNNIPGQVDIRLADGIDLHNEAAVVLSQRPEFPADGSRCRKACERNLCKPAEISAPVQAQANSAPLPYYYALIPAVRTNYIPLVNKQAYATRKVYQELLLADAGRRKNASGQKPSFSISGHFAPGYADGKYKDPGKNAQRTFNSSAFTKGIFNMSGGIKLAVHTGKRIAFQMGILYTQIGQESRNETNGFPKLQLSAPTPVCNAYIVSSPLGKIKNKNRTSSIYYTANSVSAESSTVEQLFGSVEIPLAVKYYLNDNKLKFSLSGGFSGSFVVSNKAYLTLGNQREYVGRTEDIRTFNLSTDWTLGMEYPLSSCISVMLEPGFRYYLQSISKDENIDFKPYIFSLSTGIGIRF